MISGVDYVFSTNKNSYFFFFNLEQRIREFWPSFYKEHDLEDKIINVFYSKSKEMFDSMDDNGFHLDNNKEGCFLIMFNELESEENRVTLILPESTKNSGFCKKVFGLVESLCQPKLKPLTKYSFESFLYSDNPQKLCNDLESELISRLRNYPDQRGCLDQIVKELKIYNHDLWSFDASDDFEIWSWDYMRESPGQGLEISWEWNGESKDPDIEISFRANRKKWFAKATFEKLIKEGALGGLNLGSSKQVVSDLLGSPTDVSTFKDPLIWKYGNLEITFKNDQIILIMIRFNSLRDNPVENIHWEGYFPSIGESRTVFEKELNKMGIKTSIYQDLTFDDQVTLNLGNQLALALFVEGKLEKVSVSS